MKNYNFDLAKKIIQTISELTEIESASLGMQEDWFWTAETIYKDGKYTKDLVSTEQADYLSKEYKEKRKNGMSIFSDEASKYDSIFIGGIYGSYWATPVIQIDFTDGSQKIFECFSGVQEIDEIERIKKSFEIPSGCLSAPVQIERSNLEVEKFNG